MTDRNILIGVTLPPKWVAKIDVWVKSHPLMNRQDFIRIAVGEKLGE